MGRRTRGGLVESLASLPWPFGVAFGVGAFAIVEWVLPPFFVSKGGLIGPALAKAMESMHLAWILLGIGLLCACLSAFSSRGRSRLLEEQRSLETLRALPWARFERLVAEAYSRQGYRVEETGQGGADGGIDLLLTKDGATTLVQCKQWRARQVGVSVVREMFGLMHHHGAAAVKVVCTGVFSSDCYRFAVGKPLELVDGEALLKLVKGVQATPQLPALVPASPVKIPACPKCSSNMVMRANRATGEQFWGCSSYPACRGTVAMG